MKGKHMDGSPGKQNPPAEFLGVPVAHLAILAAVFLATRLPLLAQLPLVLDEAVYSIMVEEQRESFTLVPTFLHYPVSWKMAPFFWLYAVLSGPTQGLGLEIPYRLPSLLFGLLCIIPLYLILKHLSDGTTAFLSSAVFLFPFVSVYPSTALIIDSPAMLLILLSIHSYIVRDKPLWGGFFAALAFSFKLVTAFISPLLAFAYLLINGKAGKALNPAFLIALSMPISMALTNYVLLSPFDGGGQVYFDELLPRLLTSGADMDPMYRISRSADTLAYSMGPVFILGAYGLARCWKSHPFMSFWFSLAALPFLAATMYPWYYLPVLPAIAFFAVAGVRDAQKRPEKDYKAIIALGLACALSLALVYGAYSALGRLHNPEKEVGLALAGKENALIIGHFKPGLLAYKEISERRSLGGPLDYGLVIGPSSFGGEAAAAFIRDYRTSEIPAEGGSFSGIYTLRAVFRKDTGIRSFDYLALAGDLGFELDGPEVLAQSGDIVAYRRPGAQ